VSYTSNRDERFLDPDGSKFGFNYSPFVRGELYINEGDAFNWNVNAMLMYNQSVADHNFNLNLALNANESTNNTASYAYCGFPSAQFNKPRYASGMLYKPNFGDDYSRMTGGFLTVNYSYKDIYLFDLSVRADGSSKFGSEQRVAPFWSLGTGINLHYYNFIKKLSAVNIARVRGNYGQVGRVSFPPYSALNMYNVLMDDWYTTGMGGTLMAMGNNQLAWDKVNTLNLGLDVTLWNRLTASFSYYNKRTRNMVTNVTIPASSGFTSYAENMGEVANNGYELMVNYAVIKNSKDWSLNVTANGAHNTNKILKITETMKAYNDQVDQYYASYIESNRYYIVNEKYLKPIRKYEEGSSEYSIYGMKSLGISPENGAEVFMNRDGSITHDWNAAEQTIIGNTSPTLQGSFSLNARYKGLALYTTFMYEFGGDQYNSTLIANVESVDIMNRNVDRRVLTERWQKPGDLSPLKSISDRYGFTRPSSRFVQKHNRLTFNSLSLSYDMDRAWISRLGLSALRVSGSMNDIAVFSTIRQERGTDYPFARTFSFTLNASF
jgi:hypothetical protein